MFLMRIFRFASMKTPMDLEKHYVLPRGAAMNEPNTPARAWYKTRKTRRSKGLRLFGLACLVFIAYAHWRQMGDSGSVSSSPDVTTHGLSVKQLQEDLQTCARLHVKPMDPIGLGRARNARYIDGQKPTLIKNATVWVGEPNPERPDKGYSWVVADVFLEHGLVKRVERSIQRHTVPSDVLVYDAAGRPLTSGIIDMHSHAGVHSLPTIRANDDTSELSDDITPYVRSMDGFQPTDPQLQVIKSGGVTTSLILPGSGNNIGGEAFVIKHAVGKTNGRNKTSVADLFADPDRTWRYMKMACGQNPKHIHGRVGERGPTSRLGESWELRHAFEQASKLRREQNDWCEVAAMGLDRVETYLPSEIRWDALVGVLRGQVHVHVHCYTIPDLEAFVDHTNEFKFRVQAFHHAHQAYLVPEVLKNAWGGHPPALALFADNMWYKAEAYIGSEYAGKHLYDNGLVPIYVSDNPILNAQHVVLEAAKAYRYGLPYHAALASVTTAPAERLGLGHRLGKVKPGFDADIVVWDSDPLSLGAAPAQVWIDGTAQYENPVEMSKPFDGTIVPDEGLATIVEKPIAMDGDVVFTGIAKVLISTSIDGFAADGATYNVAVSHGNITCIGRCDAELRAAIAASRGRTRNTSVFHLKRGYLTPSFTAFGSTLGLTEIDDEKVTDNGVDGDNFSRAVDGLALATEKLRVAERYGVTRAISAPKFAGVATHHGSSVGFLTGAATSMAPGAVFRDDVALHYTLDQSAKNPSISAAIGTLRRKLLEAAAELDQNNEQATPGPNTYSERAFLKRVVLGEMPLAITVHSADTIAAVLRVKAFVEETVASSAKVPKRIRLLIIGGAEAHILARELASSRVGVVLAPMQSFAVSWDQRRALTGPPVTNGTAIDYLIDAGVVTGIGLEEDWVVRDLGLLAGIAHSNSGGRLGEKEAVGLVSHNLYKMLGLKAPEEKQHFLIHEGSPLETGSRIKAVGGGLGHLKVY